MSAAPRRRAAALLAGALCGVALAAACAPRATRVVLIGDSITAGTASEPKGPGYAELLSGLLGEEFEVVNVACSGSTSLDWRPDAGPTPCPEGGGPVPLYAARARSALPADVATILLGSNDALGAFELGSVEPEAYGEALRALADALHADGAREVVLLSPPLWIGGARRLAGYRPRIQALCGERPFLHCGPDLASLLGAADFAPGDVHPNGSGHAKIAAALTEMLRGRQSQALPGLRAR